MSTQKFSPAFREALWEAHNRKCIYCRRELLLAEMRVDHVLPEYLNEKPAERSKILQRIGLSKDFSILKFENLALACALCNDEKGAKILPDGSLAIFFAKVRDKVPNLEARIKERRTEQTLESVLRIVARSIDSGKFSHEQLSTGLETLRKFPNGISGSSPAAPPASPETLAFNFKLRERKITFTKHALERMRERNITSADILREVLKAAKHPNVSVKRGSNGPAAYLIRGQHNLRVAFEMRAQEIRVVTAFFSR